MANLGKRIRELKRQLLASELEQIAKMIDASDANEEAALAAIVEKKNELGEIESKYLIQKASRWGIEVPYNDQWYESESRFDARSGLTSFGHRTARLNDLGKSAIAKQIRDARFAYWKGWTDILIPILALIVAILAILKK